VRNNNYSKNPSVTPCGLGHRLIELMRLLKEGLKQQRGEKLRNKGRLGLRSGRHKKKELEIP
jgi:hypothetical protein